MSRASRLLQSLRRASHEKCEAHGERGDYAEGNDTLDEREAVLRPDSYAPGDELIWSDGATSGLPQHCTRVLPRRETTNVAASESSEMVRVPGVAVCVG
jgi:hypothetical protein